ncbi:chemotaxis-specific protein-glutamate methyltransferase CheB [Priestia megaterium]|uniref:Protein-glutamate methylesterase/protein-glutamine glutaminase n=1 Tax=Priestia megaterium TaxID=1404 RepID=A0A6M6E102_PRIMG|nr:chemotaxis-specific protein-glutamate methyltransferase CheB [Priestia megaterium]QJX80500.1 chemotaxis-specific protein-glutamate methyltransferase CheB [Priestia megaterium]
MIRVMLVDDSSFMRKLTKNMLADDQEITIVAEAKNGEDALQVHTDDIDVVLLDIEMPKMTGLEVLETWYKANKNITTIMFSSLTKNGASETIRALDLGAFDFIEKPNNPVALNQKKEEIIEKIKSAYKHNQRKQNLWTRRTTNTLQKPLTTSNRGEAPLAASGKSLNSVSPKKNTSPSGLRKAPATLKNLILIGCSTGGPKALKEIIPMFPGNLNAAILIVQHMPKGDYTRSLAETLNRVSELTVHEAKNGQKIENGNVYIAPGGHQMKINNEMIVLTEDPPESGHAPSVDYMFREVLNKKGFLNLYPVVLTGMGADGSKSSLLLSNSGIETTVESEETCVVFGMPKKVIEVGAKNKTLPLADIPNYVTKKLN